MMCFLSFMSFAACGVQVQYCDVFRRVFFGFSCCVVFGLGIILFEMGDILLHDVSALIVLYICVFFLLLCFVRI